MDMDSSSFQEFVRLCEAEELLSRPVALAPNDVCDGLNDTVTLQRFFTARLGKPEDALAQFKEAVNIRNSINHIETYDTMNVEEYETVRKLYPHWTGRRDKSGRPIVYFDVSHVLDKSTMSEYMKNRDVPADKSGSTKTGNPVLKATQQAVAFHDTLTRFILPLCSAIRDRPDPDTPVSSAVYLVDAASVGWKEAYTLRHYGQDSSTLLSTSFPEVLKTVYIVNAPAYFATLWNFLKKWIDPHTREKTVVVTAANTLSALQADIDIENIPQSLGGKHVFEAGMQSSLDQSISQQLDWIVERDANSTLPRGPVKWVVDEKGVRTAVAVGTIDGKARLERIAVLRPEQSNGEQSNGEQSNGEKSNGEKSIGEKSNGEKQNGKHMQNGQKEDKPLDASFRELKVQ